MTGVIATSPWFRIAWRRRTIAIVLAILFAILALYPRSYRAAVTMTPTDPGSLGLGGALGQLGALSSVFGNQAAIEISLKVGRSADVRRIVAQRLNIQQREHLDDAAATDRWLQGHAEVRVLRGGLIQIDARRPSGDDALQLVNAFAEATRQRLAEINRGQTQYKRSILNDLVEKASERYGRAQRAYDAFRRSTRYTTPGPTIGSIGLRVPQIEQGLKDLQVQRDTLSTFATSDSLRVQQVDAQIAALRQQLNEARSLQGNDPYAVNTVVNQQIQLEKLERELSISYGLYVSYRRYLEGTAVEDLTSMANVRILEPPHIDSARQINILPATLSLLIILIALAIEFYLAKPPLEERRLREGQLVR